MANRSEIRESRSSSRNQRMSFDNFWILRIWSHFSSVLESQTTLATLVDMTSSDIHSLYVYLHLQMPRHVFCWRYQSERAASRTFEVQFLPRQRHASTQLRQRAGKGAPKTLIFAIYFKPKCEELLLELTVWNREFVGQKDPSLFSKLFDIGLKIHNSCSFLDTYYSFQYM